MIVAKATSAEIFEGFHPSSKIWIYASNNKIEPKIADEINKLLADFTKQWTAHDQSLKGAGLVFYEHFIVLAVDESMAQASGCSIDKSVHFIKTLEQQFGLSLFERMTVYFTTEKLIKTFSFNNINDQLEQGLLTSSTLVFDTTITRLNLFRTQFLVEASKTWLGRYLN